MHIISSKVGKFQGKDLVIAKVLNKIKLKRIALPLTSQRVGAGKSWSIDLLSSVVASRYLT